MSAANGVPGAPAAEEEAAIVLFDGVCNLCNGAVNFILKRDSRGRFRFAALQSAAGRRLLRSHGLHPERIETLVCIAGGRVQLRSAAVLAIGRRLPGAWPLLAWLAWPIPRLLRDFLYDRLAAGRYRWFGRREFCRLPTPQERARFLDDAG